MIKAAIAGATGYTGGEVLRLLLNHPKVEITSAYSTSCMGLPVSVIHRDLLGETDLCFSKEIGTPDILFLCLGHGLSKAFLDEHIIPDWCKIVDLGNDFRLEPEYCNADGSIKMKFVYGLSDVFTEKIKKAQYIANPGCFATAIQAAIVPLATNGLITDDVHVHAITGSTGAGKKLSDTNNFSYRNNNISVYKPFTHQHLSEIYRTLNALCGGYSNQVNFVPMRGDFSRGIFASVYTKWTGYRGTKGEIKNTQEDAIQLFKEYYKTSPFTFISDEPISIKEVVNTNKCLLHIELHNEYIHITSVIDNLIKGAAGQAVENMNLMFGIERTTGLKLKPSSF